jgi:hypothetical protein
LRLVTQPVQIFEALIFVAHNAVEFHFPGNATLLA